MKRSNRRSLVNTVLRLAVSALLVFGIALVTQAQNASPEATHPTTAEVTIARGEMRFRAPESVTGMRLEVFNQSGDKVFDSDETTDKQLLWPMQDQNTKLLESGLYSYALTLKTSDNESPQTQRGYLIVDWARDRATQGDRFWVTSRNALAADAQAGEVIVTGESNANLVGVRAKRDQQPGSDSQDSTHTWAAVESKSHKSKKSNPDVHTQATDMGTPGQIAKWITTKNLGDSIITETSGGLIGIGTTAPTSKLEIAAQDGLAITGPQPFLTLRDTNAGGARSVIGSGSGNLSFYPNSFIGASAPVTINNSGNVGIGSTNPENRLQVETTAPAGSAVFARGPTFGVSGVATASNGIGVTGDSTNIGVNGRAGGRGGTGVLGEAGPTGIGVAGRGGLFGVYGSSDSGEGVHGDSTTNLGVIGGSISGIGVVGDSQQGTGVQAGSDVGTAVMGLARALGTGDARGVVGILDQFTSCPGTFAVGGCAGNTSGHGVYGKSTNGFAGYFDGRLYASGKVGLGTTDPQRTLQVGSSIDSLFTLEPMDQSPNAGYIRFGDNTGWKLHFGRSKEDSAANGGTLNTGTTGVLMTIQDNGRVGIGTTAPDQLLSVNGNASKVGGGSWASFSDERLKNVKGRFTLGLNAVMQLKPLRYEYKRDNDLNLKSEGEHVGFSAQAVQKIIPEAVSKADNGFLLVNNDPILWTMLNAIKEQQALIRRQQQQIDGMRKLVCRSRRRGSVCK